MLVIYSAILCLVYLFVHISSILVDEVQIFDSYVCDFDQEKESTKEFVVYPVDVCISLACASSLLSVYNNAHLKCFIFFVYVTVYDCSGTPNIS